MVDLFTGVGNTIKWMAVHDLLRYYSVSLTDWTAQLLSSETLFGSMDLNSSNWRQMILNFGNLASGPYCVKYICSL